MKTLLSLQHCSILFLFFIVTLPLASMEQQQKALLCQACLKIRGQENDFKKTQHSKYMPQSLSEMKKILTQNNYCVTAPHDRVMQISSTYLVFIGACLAMLYADSYPNIKHCLLAGLCFTVPYLVVEWFWYITLHQTHKK